jgi:hypothetical protein
MKHSTSRAPSVQLTLQAHAPRPARVQVFVRPLSQRLQPVVAVLAACAAVAVPVAAVPPAPLWCMLPLGLGLWLAHRSWTGRYIVRAFAGRCPRCGRALRLAAGTRIDLPHTLPCAGCHHAPILEADGAPPPPAELLHQRPDCPGQWVHDPAVLRTYLVCPRCSARVVATPATQRLADRENELGRILLGLTREGRSPM